MSSIILQVDNLAKHYGSVRALDGVSFFVQSGSVCGILGPNGSGKTTLLGLLLGVLRPTRGRYVWWPNGSHTAPPRVGSLLEQANFYPYLSGIRNLRLVCVIRRVSSQQVPTVLERVGLSAAAGNMKVAAYSLGMRQRLALAAALIGEPELLVLDEPTNGLDPSGIAQVRDLIVDLRQRGTTVILASHLLGEVEKVCSHIGVLQQGALTFYGAMAEVVGEQRWIDLGYPDRNRLQAALEKSELITEMTLTADGLVSVQAACEDVSTLNQVLSEYGVYVNHLAVRRSDLESRILTLLQESR